MLLTNKGKQSLSPAPRNALLQQWQLLRNVDLRIYPVVHVAAGAHGVAVVEVVAVAWRVQGMGAEGKRSGV